MSQCLMTQFACELIELALCGHYYYTYYISYLYRI